MVLKIFKGVWFFSLMALFAAFIYVYAGLPEEIQFSDVPAGASMPRSTFFYASALVFALINSLVFLANQLVNTKSDSFSSWFYGLVISFNAYFTTSLSYIYVVNGGERYNYPQMGPGMYFTLILLVGWIAAGLILYIFKKFLSKQTI
jgi:hypothetical protein